MKKLTAILICLLLSAALTIPVLAAGTTMLTVSSDVTTAKPGDEIEFKVSMSGSEKCTSFGLLLEYDSKVFEVVEGKCTLDDVMFSTFDKDKGLACMLSEASAPSGEVATFTLRVKAGAPAGTVEVSGTSSVKNGGDTVESEVEEVKLTISGGAAQSGGNSGSQSSSSSGSQSGSTSTAPEKPVIGEAETVTATQGAQEQMAAPEETPEAPAPVDEEVPSAEKEKESSEELLIMPAPETAAKEPGKDMIVIAVAGVVVLLAAVVLVIVLKKGRR